MGQWYGIQSTLKYFNVHTKLPCSLCDSPYCFDFIISAQHAETMICATLDTSAIEKKGRFTLLYQLPYQEKIYDGPIKKSCVLNTNGRYSKLFYNIKQDKYCECKNNMLTLNKKNGECIMKDIPLGIFKNEILFDLSKTESLNGMDLPEEVTFELKNEITCNCYLTIIGYKIVAFTLLASN
jgi:hypothetical protein